MCVYSSIDPCCANSGNLIRHGAENFVVDICFSSFPMKVPTHRCICRSPPRPNLDEVVPVSGYKIKISSASSPPKIVLAVAFPTETSIGGLSADTEYAAAICAINLHGMSEFSVDSDPVKTRKGKLSLNFLCSPSV